MMNPQGTSINACTTDHVCCIKCVSWTAIFVGALVGVGLSFLLNLFGMSIGLTAYASTVPTSTTEANTIAIGGLLGLLIITIVSMGMAGYVAGCLGKRECTSHCMGALYGFTTWCVALVMSILLSTHVGHFVSTNLNEIAHQNMTNVNVNTNNNAPLMSTQDNGTSTDVNVNAEKAAKAMAMTSFIAFLLFAIGALAAAIGGHCGLSCCRNKGNCGPNVNNTNTTIRS